MLNRTVLRCVRQLIEECDAECSVAGNRLGDLLRDAYDDENSLATIIADLEALRDGCIDAIERLKETRK